MDISHIVILGDSLTDRGTMDHRYLFDLIPMSILSGLAGSSAFGRFTNGFTWSDDLSAMLADEFIISHLKNKYGLDAADIADAVISGDIRAKEFLSTAYNLDNDSFVQFEGRDFVRSYAEGGLSAYSYKGWPSSSISRYFSRLILSTLEDKREALLAYDKAHELSNKHKSESLIIEWSGANDLITVNKRPSKIEVERAINARILNAEILIKNGYHHFILFNLPDLSLTPRFQNMTGVEGENERENARECCAYFNAELQKAVQKLKETYPHSSIDVFDINSIFTEVYNNPEHYGFEPDKLKQPYTTSADFKIEENGTSPAPGYMFWDNLHPIGRMHAELAEQGYRKFRLKYNFIEPDVDSVQMREINISEEALRASFITKYGERLREGRSGFFDSHRRERFDYKSASLEDILRQASEKDGSLTREVITDLQWFDKEGNLNLNVPALKKAMRNFELHSQPETQLFENN